MADPLSVLRYDSGQFSEADDPDSKIKELVWKLGAVTNLDPIQVRLTLNSIARTSLNNDQGQFDKVVEAIELLFQLFSEHHYSGAYYDASGSPMDESPESLPRKPGETDTAFAIRLEQWCIATGLSNVVSLEDEEFDQAMNEMAAGARYVIENPAEYP